jgi:hypothetical protein
MTNQVGSKAWDTKSTCLSFRTPIPNHSRPARRLVVAAAHGSRVEHFAHIGRLFRLDGDFNL